jgi:hypothetical protein
MNDPMTVAKKALSAYTDSDREALEALIAEDFHFTSPIEIGSIARPISSDAGRITSA